MSDDVSTQCCSLDPYSRLLLPPMRALIDNSWDNLMVYFYQTLTKVTEGFRTLIISQSDLVK